MKLFTLCAFALTLAIVGVVADSDAAENSQQQHSGIERGSEVEFLDKEGAGAGAGKHTKSPSNVHNHRTRRPHISPKHHSRRPHYRPTRHPRPVHRRTTTKESQDIIYTIEPVTLPDDNGTTSSSSSISPFNNDTTTTSGNSSSSIRFETTTSGNHSTEPDPDFTTHHDHDYPTDDPDNYTTRYYTTEDPNEGQDCELFSIQEQSFLSRLNYWKDSLVKNFEKYGSNPHISTFYKTIYVRKCSYYSGEEEDFGFNIHYLLKVSACRVLREQNDGQTFGNTTWKTTTRAHRDCSSLPSTVARCEADLLSDRVHFRGCELDNLEKSNPSA